MRAGAVVQVGIINCAECFTGIFDCRHCARSIDRAKKNRQAFATAAPNHTPSLVGAGSTRESHTAVLQVQRAKPFAGRARSHRDRWRPLVGAGSTREGHTAVHPIHRGKPFAGRARSHRDRWRPLWERVLPAKATRRSARYNVANSSRAEPAPTGISATQGGNCSPEGAAARVISGTALPRWSR